MPQQKSTSPILPYAALGIGILTLSLSAMFVRWADAPGPMTGFYRMFLAAAILAPFVAVKCLRNCAIQPKTLIFPLIGGIATGCDLALWNTALSYTTAANATLIGNSAPLWVALAGLIFFKERLGRDFWFGLLLALGGAALIMGSDFILHPRLGIGDLMTVGTSLFYAVYFLSTGQGRKFIEPLAYTWLIALFAAVTLFLINLFLGNSFTGFSSATWLSFLGAALVSQVIGYFSMTYALGHLPASVVSPTMIGQPVMTTLLAIPLLGEIPGKFQLIGGLIALSGIYLVNQAHASAEKNQAKGV